MEKRVISTQLQEEDYKIESSLRPQRLEDYIGQEKIKSNMKVYIEAAKARQESLDHVLFYGPPGLGKTTLAGIIANEMGTHLKVTSGPAIAKPGEMAAILNNLAEGDILFVDEIHRLNRQVEEVLYPAMEDYVIDVMIGKGESARSIRLNLPKFTLVGATTRAGMLSAPLRDRFGVVSHMEYYTVEELRTIILQSAQVLDVEIDEKGAYELARRSRGTPRLANRLLKRVRDFAQVKYDGKITYEVAAFALDLLEVDKMGLDQNDRNIILTSLTAVRWDLIRWQLRLVRIPEPSKMFMNRIWSKMISSTGHRRGALQRHLPMNISGGHQNPNKRLLFLLRNIIIKSMTAKRMVQNGRIGYVSKDKCGSGN